MSRTLRTGLPIGLIAAGLALWAVYLLTPVRIVSAGGEIPLRCACWTVAQALERAGVALTPADRVSPRPADWIPADGRIDLARSTLISVWAYGQAVNFPSADRLPANLLALAGVRLFPGDRVLAGGRDIALDRALPDAPVLYLQVQPAAAFTLVENGTPRRLTSTAAGLGQALWENNAPLLPGDRSDLPLESDLRPGLSVTVERARRLTVRVGGVELARASSAATVGAALADAGIALQGLDYAVPAEDSALPGDGQVRVVRVREEVLLTQSTLPFKTTYAPDPNADLDTRSLVQAGKMGVKMTRARVRYEDGVEVARSTEAEWTAALPVDQVMGMGTRVTVKQAQAEDGTSIEYWRAVQAYATSYSPCQQGLGRCSWATSSGTRLARGVVAVTLSWYRLFAGQRVYIPGYGFGVVADVGGGIPGRNWIDLGYSEEDYEQWGSVVTVYFLGPVPASSPPLLP